MKPHAVSPHKYSPFSTKGQTPRSIYSVSSAKRVKAAFAIGAGSGLVSEASHIGIEIANGELISMNEGLIRLSGSAAFGGLLQGGGAKLAELGDTYRGGFSANGTIGSLPTGENSEILKNIYLTQVNSKIFKIKLGIHNSIKKGVTLGRSKWVEHTEIMNALEHSTQFKVGASTIHKVSNGFIVGGNESLGYLNKTISHHEMLHIGQYIRNPNIIDTRPIGYIHEIIPSFIGTPEIYGAATASMGFAIWGVNEIIK